MIVNFDLDIFPSHISEEKLHAFRPLIIQARMRVVIILSRLPFFVMCVFIISGRSE